MLKGDTIIKILDIDHNVHMEESLDKIHLHYFTQSQSGIIDFSKMKVYISDWTGWTMLKSIQRINQNIKFRQLHTTKYVNTVPISVFIDEDQIIPAYDEMRKTGFHGEVKYRYAKRHINAGDKFRMRAMLPSNVEWQDFISMEVSDSYELCDHGYRIYTRSGFFNAGPLHFLSSDTKIEDDKELFK